jgi:hypothetical protein
MTTLRITCFALLTTGLLASSAWAQNDSKPLNLKLPPGSSDLPASNASSAKPASASTAPGVYYGDTSGATVAANNSNAATDSCDDATYKKPQVHGRVAVGVAAGNHVSGNYQSGTVNITKPLGDCKHPTGILSITAHASQSRFDYSRRRH